MSCNDTQKTGEEIFTTTSDAGCWCKASTPAEEESNKRKGFHPLLVLSTIVVVMFVLWFCPAALMKARIPQTEAAARSVLSSEKYLLLGITRSEREHVLANTKFADDLKDVRVVSQNYIPLQTQRIAGGMRPVILVPRFYDRTARNSYCLLRNTVYIKDLGSKPEGEIVFDKSWTEQK